jgi:cholesterol 7-dehydrogenase
MMSILTAVLSFIFNLISMGKKKVRRPVDMEFEPQRAAQYPPPYPNGWYNLCPSASLKKGQVIEVEAFGQKLAVFRNESGDAGVFNAFCPHLGANLSDGKVVGDRLVCPFHGWQFNKSGKCVHIPYSDREPPAKARTKSWTVKENWGLVLVWYHSEGAEPDWDTAGYLPQLAEYRYHGFSSDVLHIHLQDFAENGADYAHFNFVHNLLTIPFSSRFVHLRHKIDINFGEGKDSHMAWFTDTAKLTWNKSGQPIPNAGGGAVVTYFGPGFLVFKFNSRLAEDVMLVKTFTPVGPLKLRMEDHIFAPKGTNRFALKYIVRESAAQFHDDIVLWERKGFVKHPILVEGDGPIIKMRQWYRQFYSESSTEIQRTVLQKEMA